MKTKLGLYCCMVVILCILSSWKPADFPFETDHLRIVIDASGNISSLLDKDRSREYLPKGVAAPLLSLYKDSVYIHPQSAAFGRGGKTITLSYPNGSEAVIGVRNKGAYLRMELLSLSHRQGVNAVVWGPIPTVLSHWIGETVAVVRDPDFSIGVQALNINTTEGLPEGDDNAGGGGFIDPLPGQYLPDSLRDKVGQPVEVLVNTTGDMPEYVRLYRGSAAVKRVFGSELRLFSRDRRIPRILGKGNNLQYVQPVDVDFIGTAIALFGCPGPSTLDVIGKIELGEGLPHPELGGKWIKQLPMGQAYMLYEDSNLAACLEYAKACDFKLVHIGDVFHSWGHFGLETDRFPHGAQDIKAFTDKARSEGISIGIHTLTMFTGKNDPYVSPVPSDSLCKTGSSVLTADIKENDDVIYIKDPSFFRNLGTTHTAKIGKELIAYNEVSGEEPWRLLNCIRGQLGTAKASHAAGSPIDKLTNDSYSGFYPDIHLQDQYAKRLAAVCNETGIGLMDFDGFGGESPTGQGTYGAARFIDLWYKNLDHYHITCGAGTFHYYWHIYSFMNWGEPWYNALRESQVNYRIENQRYFERNLMPGMLGWFALDDTYRPEEVEWIQARSAGFNAGYLLRIDDGIEKNGYKEELFGAIREWQKARLAKAFTVAQLEKFKNPKNEFHLEKKGNNSWALYPVSLQRGFSHKFRPVQTGEPLATHMKVSNPYSEQPFQCYITAVATEGDKSTTASNIIVEINNYQALTINETLRAGDRIIFDGKAIYICDANWKKLKKVLPDQHPIWKAGFNEITVKADFSGPTAPALQLEFKMVGEPESVGSK